MKKYIFSAILFIFFNKVLAQQKYWQQKNDFKIEVMLNDVDNTLTGFEQIEYFNNSPDTLNFIWIHLWPNAYKNDKTAFSDQFLENGSTAFYFSEENKRGYINQLNFKVDNIHVVMEDHPQHQDIIKILLPQALAPGKHIKIETPFHVKLPYSFSRGGHVLQSYQITQWYPKPAVYDKTGWHEMPYLDQGEFYSEFGNFDVKITLPQSYIVAATGELQNESEKLKLKNFANTNIDFVDKVAPTKTLHYLQNNVHDFAWFADKNFNVKTDTLLLKSGRVIDIYAYVLPKNKKYWAKCITNIKNAITTKSNWIGEYPYNVVSVVDNASKVQGGMEYPTITVLTADGSEASLESVINHEVGHNWFYGILASNERIYPWMDEGMNTYYDTRYNNLFATTQNKKNTFLAKRIPENIEDNLLNTIYVLNKDQPINTNSENFSMVNYGLIGYVKAGAWLKKLETELGIEVFDKLMQTYFEKYKFAHPQPQDFRQIAEEVSGKDLSTIFNLLNKNGALEKNAIKKVKLASFFNLKQTDKYNYVSIAPSIGYNLYDKIMLGALIHNYSLPPTKFRFIVSPLYATGTKKINGLARVEYNFSPTTKGDRLIISGAASKFTGGSFKDSTGTENPLQFSKIVPSIKYIFAAKNARSTIKKFVQIKSFLINETTINFTRDFVNNIDIITYPKEKRYINQLQFGVENNRALYPYNAIVQAEQGDGFVRLNFTGNYYFNFQKNGGLDVRLFAGKFIYTGNKSFTTQYKTDIYHLNMSGAKGYEDYTYSNYFVGRNEFEGFANQQIMNRDGFFKVRTDLLSSKIGKTDNWLVAVNLKTDIPKQINFFEMLPFKLPIKLFADIGTYADAWKKGATTGRLLYDAGFEISLFKNVVNIYVPILYSKVYADYFKSTIPTKRFQKNISFSIDLHKLSIANLFPQANF
ncbi:MAG: M1 family metallopeptidase [Ferruginibacter sp.]|nr:M1 family metallopeptidase [Ferruginibacter sp.]